MSYKVTVDIIRDVANEVNSGLFIHGRKVDASGSYDGLFPIIVLYPFQTVEKENVAESSILIGFFGQDSVESSMEERESLIEEMYNISKLFTDLLYQTKSTSIKGDIIREPQYQMYQGTMSGYAIKFDFVVPIDCDDE